MGSSLNFVYFLKDQAIYIFNCLIIKKAHVQVLILIIPGVPKAYKILQPFLKDIADHYWY